MDAEYSKSTTTLGIITGVDNSSLSKKDHGIYLDTKTQKSKETINLETLDHINEEALGMEMSDWKSKVRLEPYFFRITLFSDNPAFRGFSPSTKRSPTVIFCLRPDRLIHIHASSLISTSLLPMSPVTFTDLSPTPCASLRLSKQ